jgi:hypothetical protein
MACWTSSACTACHKCCIQHLCTAVTDVAVHMSLQAVMLRAAVYFAHAHVA